MMNMPVILVGKLCTNKGFQQNDSKIQLLKYILSATPKIIFHFGDNIYYYQLDLYDLMLKIRLR